MASEFQFWSLKDLKGECTKRQLGNSYWRNSASKAEMITALETGEAPSLPGRPALENPAGQLADIIAQIAGQNAPALDEEAVKAIVQEHCNTALKAALENLAPRKIEITVADRKTIINRQHKHFDELLNILAVKRDGKRKNILLSGPSGSGKTHVAESCAEALGLPFYGVSVCSQTTESRLFGFIDANGRDVASLFRKAYEHGGVFLVDEIDAGNPNVLTSLNAATSNGQAAFPSGMVKRHPDFTLIAAANTWGTGANAIYIGRNQLDEATRSRFLKFFFDYDEDLEAEVCGNASWAKRVQSIRHKADKLEIRRVISPRASIDGADLLAAGFAQPRVEELTIFADWSADEKAKVI